MIGAIIGDLAGSEYEWSECKFKSTLLPFLFQDPRFTDDTVMTLAVADALMSYDDVMGFMKAL
jgi:type I restriction enzyme M protein